MAQGYAIKNVSGGFRVGRGVVVTRSALLYWVMVCRGEMPMRINLGRRGYGREAEMSGGMHGALP